MVAILQTQDLVMTYPKPRVEAVRGVSLTIPAGVCFGLLGPNGAGKTTTVEMMEGVTKPTSGQVLYHGKPIGRDYRARIGIQFQKTALQDFLKVKEVLKLFQSLYREKADLQELAHLCALEEFWDRDANKLSGGQRQRVLLAIALVNNPEIVFLDEPTTGLDPQARRNFWDLVQTIKASRRTVVLTTHYMEEAYVLCDEIAIMDHGHVIAQGKPDALLSERFSGVTIVIPLGDYAPLPDSPIVRTNVKESDGVVEIHTTHVNETMELMLKCGINMAHMKVRSRTLEDLFIELTGKQLRN